MGHYSITLGLLFLLILGVSAVSAAPAPRQRLLLDDQWKFLQADVTGAETVNFDDGQWRTLNLPHDWNIEGEIKEDAATKGNGGYLPAGVGWYRRHLHMSAVSKEQNTWIEFDGVYMNSEVWLNGHSLGRHPHGDLLSMIHRDRNHPSVVLWSAGNEVMDQGKDRGVVVLKALIDTFHKEDPTRPVTVANDRIADVDYPAKPAFLDLQDVVGYNYVDRWLNRRELYYSIDRQEHPDWKMIGTENIAVRGARGRYSLPSGTPEARDYRASMIQAEQLLKFTAVHNYVIGDFMWAKIDYLGEANWPSKSSSSGVIDLCGFPKDSYYSAELFLNGKSFGKKSAVFPQQGNSGGNNKFDHPFVNATTSDLHLSWDVPYESGTLQVVGTKDGTVVTEEIRTTAKPAAICLSANGTDINADAWDIANVKVEVVDENGLVVPDAENLVEFHVAGAGTLAGTDNGNPQDKTSMKSSKRSAFGGLALAVIQSTGKPGTIRLTAVSESLKGAELQITSHKPDGAAARGTN